MPDASGEVPVAKRGFHAFSHHRWLVLEFIHGPNLNLCRICNRRTGFVQAGLPEIWLALSAARPVQNLLKHPFRRPSGLGWSTHKLFNLNWLHTPCFPLAHSLQWQVAAANQTNAASEQFEIVKIIMNETIKSATTPCACAAASAPATTTATAPAAPAARAAAPRPANGAAPAPAAAPRPAKKRGNRNH